jgi:tetratricopeptide (TPR) repeat protein
MLTRWKQINEKYNITLNNGVDGELTDLEKTIYNGMWNLTDDINIQNADTLVALSNYYMLIGSDIERVIILNKLVEVGDARGYANLGCYYFNSDRNLAIQYFEQAINMGNLNAKYNLIKHYLEISNLEKAKIYCEELVNVNYVPAYLLMSQIYGWMGNLPEMTRQLGLGAEQNDTNCINTLELMFEGNLLSFRQYLSTLNNSTIIKTKIDSLDKIINNTNIF